MNKSDANHKFGFLNELDLDQSAVAGLSMNLSRIYSGDTSIYESPMATAYGAENILSEWSKLFWESKGKMNDTLLEIEKSQETKTGPRSRSVPWSKRREGVLESYEDNELDYSSLDATPQAYRDKGILRPLSTASAANYLKNSTNSGLPFYINKGKAKDRVLARFLYYLNRQDPCVLFTRTQEGYKTRDVWGYPIVDTLNEMMYYRPILAYQKQLDWRSSLNGPEATNLRITHIISRARSMNLELISVDFSAYDRSIKQGLQRKVFEYYKYLYQSKERDNLEYICNRKSTIGLVTPDGVLTGPHGEPSGSTFTNEDDSIAQRIISMKSGVIVEDLCDIQGDDGVYAVRSVDVETLFKTFKRFGIDVNVDKSYKSFKYVVYLQNLYHIDYLKNGVIGGIYPSFRALNRILYQERWVNFEDYDIVGKDYYSIRTISILENCKHHPLFVELVTFVHKYDKFDLRVSQKGIGLYVKMLTETSGIEGILVNQYGDDLKGILNFETVKLVRTLN